MTELTFVILKYVFVIALWLFAWMVTRSLHHDVNAFLPSSKRGHAKRKRKKESVLVGTHDSSAPSAPVHVNAAENALPPTNQMPESNSLAALAEGNDDMGTQALNNGAEATSGPTLLIVIDGPLAGATVPLTGQPITLGRGTSNTVVLDDEYVSSQHARVYLDPATHRWMIEDLNSTNGTFVNETRIKGIMALPERVPVRIGATTFELR